MHKLATNTMELRQLGAPITEVMKILPESEVGQKVVKGWILEAYETPRYHSAELRQNAVIDFANDVAADCYRRM
jgi:hypothetical protein